VYELASGAAKTSGGPVPWYKWFFLGLAVLGAIVGGRRWLVLAAYPSCVLPESPLSRNARRYSYARDGPVSSPSDRSFMAAIRAEPRAYSSAAAASRAALIRRRRTGLRACSRLGPWLPSIRPPGRGRRRDAIPLRWRGNQARRRLAGGATTDGG
jgi:hypothetical protein